MPALAVAEAVDARLAANWTATEVVAYDTDQQPPVGIEAFLTVQYPVVNGARPTLGRKFWEEGAIRLVLNVQATLGLEQALTWTDELSDLFRAVKFSGVETFEPSGPVIVDDIDDGAWITYSIVVPYRYQFDG